MNTIDQTKMEAMFSRGKKDDEVPKWILTGNYHQKYDGSENDDDDDDDAVTVAPAAYTCSSITTN